MANDKKQDDLEKLIEEKEEKELTYEETITQEDDKMEEELDW